jgi:hypothetical protein
MGRLDEEVTLPEWRSSARCPDEFVDYEKTYEKNKRLSEILDGKTVAFLCPGGKEEYTGDHDVIVRAGYMKPVRSGRQADVIVHSFNQFEMPVAMQQVDFLKERFVLCPMASSDYYDEHENLFSMLGDYQNVDDAHLYWMFRKVGTVCNVGFSGLLTVLNYDIKEIFISGMTFYNMGRYGRIYNDEYYNVVSDEMKIFTPNIGKNILPKEARSDLHDQQSQIEYFRGLVRADSRIKLDHFLLENFAP